MLQKCIGFTKETFYVNRSKFWDFVKKNKSGQSIPTTVTLNDLISKNNNDLVDFFSKHFNSVYSCSNVNYVSDLTQSLINDLPSNCFFDISEVEKSLLRLKRNKSISPNGISGDFLTTIRSSMCFSLWLLFRKSLDSGSFPEILKLISITLIFKFGDTSNVANYRPITIISQVDCLNL